MIILDHLRALAHFNKAMNDKVYDAAGQLSEAAVEADKGAFLGLFLARSIIWWWLTLAGSNGSARIPPARRHYSHWPTWPGPTGTTQGWPPRWTPYPLGARLWTISSSTGRISCRRVIWTTPCTIRIPRANRSVSRLAILRCICSTTRSIIGGRQPHCSHSKEFMSRERVCCPLSRQTARYRHPSAPLHCSGIRELFCR